jgi:hypothetical protein
MVRTTPLHVVDCNDGYDTAPTDSTAKGSRAGTGTTPTRCMDKSVQGPKRAVSIARPLGVQSGIPNTEDSSSKWPAARVVQL